MKPHHFFAVSLLFLGSCTNVQNDFDVSRLLEYNLESVKIPEEEKSKQVITFDLSAIENRGSAIASEIFRNRKYINLKTPEDLIIGKVNQILRHENYLILVDYEITKGVFLFDIEGNFLFRVGKEGHGPGEYLEPRSVFVKDSTIYIRDSFVNLHQFNLFDNRHISSERLPFPGDYFFVGAGHKILFTNNNILPMDLSYHIIGIDNKYKAIFTKFFKVPGNAFSNVYTNPIGYNPTYHHDSFIFSPTNSPKLYQV